ncbi:unnamed protein product, partial [Clonostachys byssicola]
MKYITIEGRNAGACWVEDPYNLQPGPAPGALSILATLLRDIEAVFVHHKMSISASEDPDRIAEDLEMTVDTPQPASFVPEFVESLSTPSLPQGGNPRGQHGPYRTTLEYFTSTAERHIDLIADGQLYPEYAKEAFAFYTLLRDQAAPVLANRSGDERKFWVAQRLSMWQGNPRGRHGPSSTPLQYFTSTAEWHLELIADDQLYPEYAKEAYVFYKLLRDQAAPVLANRSGDDPKFGVAQRLSMWQGNPRGSFSHLPAELIDSFVQNEYDTLKWLFKTGIPVVEAYGYGLASDPSNLVGVSYIFLIDKFPINAVWFFICAVDGEKAVVYADYNHSPRGLPNA